MACQIYIDSLSPLSLQYLLFYNSQIVNLIFNVIDYYSIAASNTNQMIGKVYLGSNHIED